MEKRFIFGSLEKWNLNKGTNEENYWNSIVFITETGNDKKGTMIYTHGAYFEMSNQSDVIDIIRGHLKEGKKINFTGTPETGLTINVDYVESVEGTCVREEDGSYNYSDNGVDGYQLVEARAVAGALTEPFKLSLAVNGKKGQFTQHFKTLNGDDVTFASAIIEAGDGLAIATTEGGLKLSADLSKLKEGLNYAGKENNPVVVDNTNREIYHTETGEITATEATLSGDATKTFTIPSYEFDAYGHVSGKTNTAVTLPETAFKDTTYSAGTGLKLDGTTFNHTNVVEGVSLVNAEMAKQSPTSTTPSFTFKTYAYDDQGHILGSKDATVELPATAFSDNNTEYTITTTTGTATNSVDVNLINSDTDNVSSKVAIKGGNNVTVSQDGNGVITVSATADTILSGLNLSDEAVENQYVSEVDQTNGQIAVTRATLPVYGINDTTVDGIKLSLTDGKVGLVDAGLAADLTSKNITVTKKGEEGADSFVYEIKQGGVLIGTINHPADMVVESGSVIIAPDGAYAGEKVVRLELANTDSHVDILVSDLAHVYTEGNGIDISESDVISVKLHEGEKYLAFDDDKCLVSTGIDTAISGKIDELNSTKTGSQNNVSVTVTQEKGLITSVSVTDASASKEEFDELKAEVEENAEVTAQALVELDSRIDTIEETIENLDFGVTSVQATTSSAHVTVAPTAATDGAVTVSVDVASVDATDKATFVAKGLATDAYVDEEITVAITALDATATGAVTANADENKINVATGVTITQTDGKLDAAVTVAETSVYTTEYIDSKFTAVETAGEVKLESTAGNYVFTEEKAGYVTAKNMADIMNEAWAWGTI